MKKSFLLMLVAPILFISCEEDDGCPPILRLHNNSSEYIHVLISDGTYNYSNGYLGGDIITNERMVPDETTGLKTHEGFNTILVKDMTSGQLYLVDELTMQCGEKEELQFYFQ